MMTNRKNILTGLILIMCQAVVNFYLNTGPYVVVSCLPAIVLFISFNKGVIPDMSAAFAAGFVCDLFSGLPVGISSLALVPVALVRSRILKGFFEEDVYARGEMPTMSRFGFWKMFMAGVLANALFLAVFIIAESAGTRTVGFNLLRIAASLPFCVTISLFIPNLMQRGR